MTTETTPAPAPETETGRPPLDTDIFEVVGRRASLGRLAERSGGYLTRAEIRAHVAAEYGNAADAMIEQMIRTRGLIPNDPEVPRPLDPVIWMIGELRGLEGKERVDKILEIACEKLGRPFPERITAADAFQAYASEEIGLNPRGLLLWLEARDKLKGHERVAHELCDRVFNALAQLLKPAHCEPRLCARLRRFIHPGESVHHFKRAARALVKLRDPDPKTKSRAFIAAIEASTPEVREAAADLLFRLPASPYEPEEEDDHTTET